MLKKNRLRDTMMGVDPKSFPNGNRQIQSNISIKSLSSIFISYHNVKDWNV